MTTVRQFIDDSYALIDAHNVTVPIIGSDLQRGIRVLNQLLESYAATGLLLTVAKTVSIPINLGINEVIFVDPGYNPVSTFNVIAALTAANPTFVVINPSLFQIGDAVTGTGIPALTFIASIIANTVTLTNNATVTTTANLTITRNVSDPNAVYIRQGRLANLNSAWLLLDGVTYPLIDESRDEFLASWKYEPLQGLPRFAIVFPDTDLVRVQLYPAPSQFFTFFCRGKFQLPFLYSDSDMSLIPLYFQRYLLFATAKDLAMYGGRADAWTEKLEEMYRNAKDIMIASSEVNLAITGDRESLLNGAWRVRAGI